jgi:aspartate racemase
MKCVGIIGGIAPASTVAYYQSIIKTYRDRRPDGSYPSIIINSINLQKLLSLVEANNLASATDYLVGEVQRLASAGADFGLMASNTPHMVFDEVSQRSAIPLISIVAATCSTAKARGMKRVGLFGTRFTMQGQFYPEVFSSEGISLVLPDQTEQDYIHERYMNELIAGIFLEGTREGLLAISRRLTMQEGIEGLILGGTELPLILPEGTESDIPFLDTTQIHVNAIVGRLLA